MIYLAYLAHSCYLFLCWGILLSSIFSFTSPSTFSLLQVIQASVLWINELNLLCDFLLSLATLYDIMV